MESSNICVFVTGIMFLRFLHVVAHVDTSLLFMTNIPVYGWIHCLFIISWTLGGLYLLATGNSIAVDIVYKFSHGHVSDSWGDTMSGITRSDGHSRFGAQRPSRRE